METSVKNRIAVERRIVKACIAELLSHGFTLSIFNGEDETKPTTDSHYLIRHAMLTDEDWLNVHDKDKRIGWVRFVYGNDGWDVICDYTTNLEDHLPVTLELTNKLEEARY